MSEAAVLDKPADATTETKADAVIETKDTEVKDPVVTDDDDDAVQTDTGADDAETEAEDDDHEAQLKREKEEADREAIRAEEREKLRDEAREEREKASEAARKAKAKTARKDAFDSISGLVDSLDKLGLQDADGNPFTTNKKAFTDVVELLALHVEEAADMHVQEKWWNGIARALPDEAAVKEFESEITDATPIHEVIRKLAERLAPKTEWAGKLTLDDAIAASPAIRKAVADIKEGEFEKGRKKGQLDKGKNPDAKERPSGATFATASENDRAYNAGEIDGDTWNRNRQVLRGKGT